MRTNDGPEGTYDPQEGEGPRRMLGSVEVDRNGLEVLSRDECLHLLGTATLGRIGFSAGALPSVLPVNFRLLGDTVYFRTGIGTKLDAATVNAVVAFEADDMDPLTHTGWSVVVTGVAHEVVDTNVLTDLMRAHIPRWVPGPDGRYVEISTRMISGRRILLGHRDATTSF